MWLLLRQIKFKILAVAGFLFLAWVFLPPLRSPTATVISIEPGQTVSEIVETLEDNHIIRSPLVFKIATRLFGGDGEVQAGDYFFDRPLSAVNVAWRLVRKDFGLEPLRITIPEGLTNQETAELLAARLERFSPDYFLVLADGREGYLFPDTYFFSPYARAWQVLTALEQNYRRQVSGLREAIDVSNYSEHEIITLASIIEREAREPEARRLISGILHRRLEADMPLQVDAVFPYFLGKNTFELTLDDLAVDSPYNTYRYRGLPPGPIANPGLDAIEAALNPTFSNYWFYLSDLSGNMHYAVDFEQHKLNKNRYLP